MSQPRYRLVRSALIGLTICAGFQFAGIRAASATNTCSPATARAAHALCWFDLSGYTPAPGVATPMVFTLPDGSLLSTTITNTGTTTPSIAGVPTYSGAALGNSAYAGITGRPTIYGHAAGGFTQTFTTQFSNITLTDPQGLQLPQVMMIQADAESLDSGDGAGAQINWSTAGAPWSLLELMKNTSNSPTPVCTLAGLGTASATCTANAGGNNAAYILASLVTPGQSVTMSATTHSAQGYAFAVNLAKLSVVKALHGRNVPADQFAVSIARAGTILATAATSGAGTSASASLTVTPTDTYTFSDTAAGGSAPDFTRYVSSIACLNAVASTTALPSGIGTSFSVTPAIDDQITCTFSNTALLLTNVPVTPTKTIVAGSSVSDNFTLTNAAALPAVFSIGNISLTGARTGVIVPTGYVFGGTTYASVAAAQSAINAAGATPAGSGIGFGIVYSAPPAGQIINVALTAFTSSGSSTASAETANETDGTGLTIAKTGTTATAPGGLIAYSILVGNTGPTASDLAVFSDPVPAGLIVRGTPACSTTTGAAVCGPMTVSANTVTSTIPTFPAGSSVTFTIVTSAGNDANYSNTALLTPVSGAAVSSTLATSVTAANGMLKTVRNVTRGESTGQLNNSGLPGDLLEYGLAFVNTTGNALNNPVFTDVLPTAVTFASATCGALPSGVTACAPNAPAVGAGGTVSFLFSGQLAAGSRIAATIRVLIR